MELDSYIPTHQQSPDTYKVPTSVRICSRYMRVLPWICLPMIFAGISIFIISQHYHKVVTDSNQLAVLQKAGPAILALSVLLLSLGIVGSCHIGTYLSLRREMAESQAGRGHVAGEPAAPRASSPTHDGGGQKDGGQTGGRGGADGGRGGADGGRGGADGGRGGVVGGKGGTGAPDRREPEDKGVRYEVFKGAADAADADDGDDEEDDDDDRLLTDAG